MRQRELSGEEKNERHVKHRQLSNIKIDAEIGAAPTST
jgi:hypothetical protein